MKKLLTYMKEYRMECILAPLFKLLEVAFDLLVPLIVARMIDEGILANDHLVVRHCFILLIILALCGLAASITAQYFAAKASIGFATNMRQALFNHIQSFSYTELDTIGSDTLITRLTDDINQVQNGTNLALRLILRSPFIVFGSMILAFKIDFNCALVFVVVIPILFAAVFAIMLISIPLFQKVQKALDKVTLLTRENLTGVRVIRAFAREEKTVEEYASSNDALTAVNKFVGRISSLLNPLTYIIINIATVYLIDVAAFEVNVGSLGQGDTVALYNYMLQIIVELIKLASLIITLNKSIACAKRVSGVLETEPSMRYGNLNKDLKNAEVIRFDDVSFTYALASAPSLEQISFSARAGETVGIIGATGCGKSTLVNLIARFYDATEGRVLLDGEPIQNYSEEMLRHKVGVVPQKAVLFKGSIKENLLWGNESASTEELWNALEIAQAKEIVEGKEEQLDFLLEQNGKNLSGGQRQRLTIARALVKKPEILILDDSASALDFATDAALRKALHSLTDTTTFIISQRISGVKNADQILVLDQGKLVGKGTHEELLKECEVYQEIYDSQFRNKEGDSSK